MAEREYRQPEGYSRRGSGRGAKRRGGTVVLVILLLLLLAGAAFVLLRGLLPARHTTLSLSEEAAARAYAWLSRIEDMPLSYQDVRDAMGVIELEAERAPAEEGGGRRLEIPDEAYEECRTRAELGLEQAYRATLKHRLAESGYTGELTDELLDSLMQEAYGLSVAEYLSQCGVQLLPEREELSAWDAGEEALWTKIKSLLPWS